ncbi:toll/interleukin-1 receptor domain-containing protein [Streptomyces virginiae]|uniref:toll/interleukin-1 receptor domain-containing protein n=1 Tax=Streptomyces virginiae TaxID=1961 RepID=UPI003690D384
MPERTYRRDAFISYSHQQDVPLAQALQRGLQRLGRPWTRRPTVSVFRDTTSLAASSDLGGAILKELGRSEYFIYVASPAAARSRWVGEEIAFWIRNRPMDRFLIAVSDGTIAWDRRANDFDWSRTTCLPDSMRRAFAREPLWVDLTRVRLAARYSLRDAPFRDAVATLLAPLRGVTKDAVESEDLRQRRTAVRMLRGAVAALSLLLATSLAAGGLAWQQRNEAVARARISASQALAARALEETSVNPAKAASFALYADQAGHTGESDRALAQAVVANEYTARHVQGGAEGVESYRGAAHGPMTRVALSRDGGMLAYYSDYNAEAGKVDYPPASQRFIHLYDLRAGKPLPSLPTRGWPDHGEAALRLSSDGGTLVVENYSNQLEVWDVRQARLTRKLVARNGNLFTANEGVGIALSGDGRWLAATYASSREGEGALLNVWDLASGTPVVSGEALGTAYGGGISFDGSDRLSLLTPATGQIRTLTPQSRSWSAPRSVPGLSSQGYVTELSASNDRALTRGSDTGQQELWDLAQGRRLATGALPSDWNTLLLPDNAELIVSADGPTVSLYDSHLRKQRVLGSFSRDVANVSASGDGAWVAAASVDGSVSLFARTGHGQRAVPNGDRLTPDDLTASGRLATRKTGNGAIEIWATDDPSTGPRKLGRLPLADMEGEYALAANGDGSRVVLTHGGELSVWDPRTGSRISAKRFEGDDKVSALSLSFLGDDFHVVAPAEKEVLVIDIRSWAITQRIPGDTAAVSADRTTVAARIRGELYQPSKITVWRWSGGGRVGQIGKGEGDERSHSLTISNDGSKVATMDGDRRLWIIDVATSRTVTTAGTERDLIDHLVFSADSRHVVQVSGKGAQSALQIWDASTADPMALWPLGLADPADPKANNTPHIVPSTGGGVLVYAPDGTLVHRAIESAPWREALCALTPGSLPAKEYDRYLKDIGVSAPCRG